jgi:hypothetical protein
MKQMGLEVRKAKWFGPVRGLAAAPPRGVGSVAMLRDLSFRGEVACFDGQVSRSRLSPERFSYNAVVHLDGQEYLAAVTNRTDPRCAGLRRGSWACECEERGR